jgi:hypothetical protein
MSSIIRLWDTFHGISVDGRGVLTNQRGDTYAGQCRDGYACGLGVLTHSGGFKEYAEHGPDGKYDGRHWSRHCHGSTVYSLHDRGEPTDEAHVYPNGRCMYNYELCAPDDPHLLALIALVAPVEVRPAAPTPHPPSAHHSPPSNRPMDRPARFAPRRRWRLPWPPRCNPTPHAGPGLPCGTTLHQQHCKSRPRSDACTDRFGAVVAREAPSCTLTTAAWFTPRARPGSSVALP